MKIRYVIQFFIIITSLCSCGLAIHFIGTQTKHDSSPIDTEGITNIASPSNDDNKIYTTNRSFIFEVNQWQNKKHIQFDLEMIVIPGSFNTNESKIKYKYHYNPKDLTTEQLTDFGYDSIGNFRPEFTSFTESGHYFEFHPPRSKSLECLEAAPFPFIPMQVVKGRKSKQYLYIPRGNWGKLEGSKITWRYEIDSVNYIHDTIPYFCRVSATADSKKGGHNTLQTYFNIDSGFTKWSYRFQDSTTIDFILKKIK
ncbi:MAG TPA: hypothetical protein VFF27_18730 [Bacteroidia bacterium]|jgi:hypothetical protein|nr:hypothetical protein [Bacteroidia bacterium]